MNQKQIKYAKVQINKQKMTKSLKRHFIEKKYTDLLDKVELRSAELFEENSSANKFFQVHLNQILPCIAFYEVLQKELGNKDKAMQFFEDYAYDELEKYADILRKIMRMGMYKIAPFIFDNLVNKFFGPDAGFKSIKADGAKPFTLDMVVCPYFETCKKYGCPELTQYFCKSDDITYGNMHPRLVWGRTQTLGTGGNCCDFRLHLKE